MPLEEHIKKAMVNCPLSEEQEGALLEGLKNYLDELDKEIQTQEERDDDAYYTRINNGQN